VLEIGVGMWEGPHTGAETCNISAGSRM
jgi:hypothetical protein